MSKSVFLSAVMCVGLFSHGAVITEASTIAFPQPQQLEDRQTIDSPASEQVLYSKLTGFPHLYQFVVSEAEAPLSIRAQLLLPDWPEVANMHSLLLVKQNSRGVSEVARLRGRDADWNTFYDYVSGDRYREGGVYQGSLEAGVYLLEVSTPVNEGKYALVIGEYTSRPVWQYFKSLKEVAAIKAWYGKSSIAVLQSVLLWLPLLIALLFFIYQRYRK